MTEAALIVLMETHLKEKVRCQYIARQLNAKEGPGGTVRRTGTVQELHASILRVARAKFSEAHPLSYPASAGMHIPVYIVHIRNCVSQGGPAFVCVGGIVKHQGVAT